MYFFSKIKNLENKLKNIKNTFESYVQNPRTTSSEVTNLPKLGLEMLSLLQNYLYIAMFKLMLTYLSQTQIISRMSWSQNVETQSNIWKLSTYEEMKKEQKLFYKKFLGFKRQNNCLENENVKVNIKFTHTEQQVKFYT